MGRYIQTDTNACVRKAIRRGDYSHHEISPGWHQFNEKQGQRHFSMVAGAAEVYGEPVATLAISEGYTQAAARELADSIFNED